MWEEPQAPLLSGTAELVDELHRRGVAAAAVEAVDGSLEAGPHMAEARRRLLAGEESEWSGEEEAEPVEEQAERLSEVLAEYARVLTAHLPQLRSACPA
ncbi:hypothetical protein HDA32_003109 [Spinactinospora alkalitolerans]|uniref:Uncharacterized protein n=1 Tax=Spinactinospora alkalitolerans TaxID=687207 RepID=A0A852TVE0_9ACTN|nr:hypothetical protein [Spinactinospora alkalitolerans]NYE47989.1 hypothetical protein [Spinactinospora alkalitolerans]